MLSSFDAPSVVNIWWGKKKFLQDCIGEKEHCASNGRIGPSCGVKWKRTDHTFVGAHGATPGPRLGPASPGLGPCVGVSRAWGTAEGPQILFHRKFC